MLILLGTLKKLLAILNDKASPGQIAGAVAMGAMMGLLPGFGLMSLLIFFIVLLINVNISASLFALVLFKPVGFILGFLAHKVGLLFLVQLDFLKPIWTALYNIPFLPFSRFNNTIVMGSLVLGIVLWIPIFILTKRGVVNYREKWRGKIDQWKIVKILKASSIYSFYQKIQSFRG